VKITIKNLQKKIPINPKRIRSAILEALPPASRKKSGEITVCFVNDKTIKQLNRRFLRRNCPTDVISFGISADARQMRADIAVSSDTALRNSRIYSTTPLCELYLYVVHGVLHLVGYDDKTIKGRLRMDKRSVSILRKLKFPLSP
jgi:probable rRNA maturation factor